MVLPSGADPSTEQQTKGADPRTGSLKVKRPVVLSGLAVWSWSLCSVSALLRPAALVLVLLLACRSGPSLGAFWALSWCLSVVTGPVLVSGFLVFLWATTLEPIVSLSFVEATVL